MVNTYFLTCCRKQAPTKLFKSLLPYVRDRLETFTKDNFKVFSIYIYRNGMITTVSGTKQNMVMLIVSEYTQESYGHPIY